MVFIIMVYLLYNYNNSFILKLVIWLLLVCEVKFYKKSVNIMLLYRNNK